MDSGVNLFLGIMLLIVGILMTSFAKWKIWRSRWFAMGGLFNQKVSDEKLALTATRFWGVATAIAGIIFLVLYFRK